MSTATLDGAVIAHNPDYLTENIVPLEHPGHFIVVAIDFGTTFSGYAFSFINDPDNIHVMRKWEGKSKPRINEFELMIDDKKI